MDTLMMELLTRLAWTSVQSAVLVALVWGVCRLLPRLPAATRCRLWWLVALQAVLGLAWSSPLELSVLPAAGIDTASLVAQPWVHDGTALTPMATGLATHAAPVMEPMLSWPLALLALWASGVLLVGLHSLRAYRQSRALVRNAAPCTDAGLQQALQLAAEAHGLACAPQLKTSSQIRSPQLIGPWNPVLLLPARELPAMAADDLDMALTHELVHLQRRDLWWGLLPALAQHVMFFHPLLHLAAREYALAREEACDSAVVAGHGHCRHDYGRLLVQLGVAPRPAVGVASASPNFRSLKRRLVTLQQTGSFPRVASLAITALFVVIGVAPMRLVAAVPPPPPAPPAAPAVPAAPDAPRAPAAVAAPVSVPAPPTVPALRSPAPPAAPAAPAAPTHPDEATSMVTHGRLDLGHQPAQAYVLMGDGDNFVNASLADLKQAKRDVQGRDRVLWVRRGNERYVIRDPVLLASLTTAQRQVASIGNQQGALGDQQGELGERIAALSEQATRDAMETMDAAAMANNAARRGVGDAAVAERAARRAAADAEAAIDHRRIAEIARQQAELARQQSALAQRQSVATAQIARDVRTAIDKAMADGTAQRLR
ncbi:M56 family metallopeptidase [Stenotrophomonas sp.]|uniref:M56 family metallopeptidase n=1 Tax=Stenotrophomonas sp. TaxID=69392 RepID=UPI0028AB44E4|nr:M56 family metallopeptidase [Stenotrophomonas sp.]